MKVFVDVGVCRGHGQCEDLLPQVFHITDRGNVEVLGSPGEELRALVEEAARRCPEGAIAVIG
jgi:ferredoxin